MRRSLAIVCALGLAACQRGSVVRIVDGEAVPHRFISPYAYASYARGVRAEAAKNYVEAFNAFGNAAAYDPEGAEPWTRMGAVACRLEKLDDADRSFERAEEADPTFAPLWRERAACALQRSDLKLALSASERAEALAPDSTETVLLRSAVLERTGDRLGALREVVGLTVRKPSRTAWQRQLELAGRSGDEPAARLARNALREGAEIDGPANLESMPPSPPAGLDAALARGDQREAERLGRRMKLSPSSIALRAVALGHEKLAFEMALRILGANPLDGDAYVAAVTASESKLDLPALAKLLDQSRGTPMSPPSGLGSLLLLDVLSRRVGPEALTSTPTDPVLSLERGDPLEETVRQRVVRTLSASRPSAAQPRSQVDGRARQTARIESASPDRHARY